MIKLKPITETSWLVIGDTEETKIGLLTEMRHEYILMIKGEKKKFLNRKEINSYFKDDIFNNVVTPDNTGKEDKTFYILGYPVDFNNPHEVIIPGNNLPLYRKKASSEVFYCAGYYCLQCSKNWMPAFCPKLSTLESYQYLGPFKTELEMKAELARIRKAKI